MIRIGMKLKKSSIFMVSWFHLVFTPLCFFLSACTAAAIIILEPCALNAELQHFIHRFNKISLLGEYH
jgi:hypothetical protein